MIVGDFRTPLSPIESSFREKLNKGTPELNDIINQMDITDINITFHPNTKQYTFFSAACGAVSKTEHILRHESSLKKFRKIEITPCILSDTSFQCQSAVKS